jgi:hypothetical protein
MIISDEAAIALLNGPETVRDDLLVRVEFIEPSSDDSAVVTMEFISGAGRARRGVTLVFRGVSEFGFYYEKDRPRDIAMFKCLKTDDGDYYVSLDPYDEHETGPNQQDGDVVRAKHIDLQIDVPE